MISIVWSSYFLGDKCTKCIKRIVPVVGVRRGSIGLETSSSACLQPQGKGIFAFPMQVGEGVAILLAREWDLSQPGESEHCDQLGVQVKVKVFMGRVFRM